MKKKRHQMDQMEPAPALDPEALAQRDARVVDLRRRGLHYEEIAQQVGLTRQRVQQIVYRLAPDLISPRRGRRTTLTRKQRRLYEMIVEYKIQHNGISPNQNDLIDMAGYAHSQGTYGNNPAIGMSLRRLQALGLIRLGRGPRTIEVVGERYIPPPPPPWKIENSCHTDAKSDDSDVPE